jgi:hypothetical protein
MYLGPIVCSANKGKKEFGVVQRLSVEYTLEGTERPRRIASFQEDMPSTSKDCPFLCTVRLRWQRHHAEPLTQSKVLIQVGFKRKITTEQRQHFVKRLGQALCVARRTTQAYQESKMSSDTVTDAAEKR